MQLFLFAKYQIFESKGPKNGVPKMFPFFYATDYGTTGPNVGPAVPLWDRDFFDGTSRDQLVPYGTLLCSLGTIISDLGPVFPPWDQRFAHWTTKTGKSQSVKWSMLNLHFWSVCLDWTVTFFIVPFVLFPTVAGFSLGVFNYMGLPLERQCYLFAALLCSE